MAWLELKDESLWISQLNHGDCSVFADAGPYKLRCGALGRSRFVRGRAASSPAPDDSSRPSTSAEDDVDEDDGGVRAVGKLALD